MDKNGPKNTLCKGRKTIGILLPIIIHAIRLRPLISQVFWLHGLKHETTVHGNVGVVSKYCQYLFGDPYLYMADTIFEYLKYLL
jgi:hypothetical protein